MIIDLEYAGSTAAGMTVLALAFLPLVYVMRLPAWMSALSALFALGGLYMFRPRTVFEYGVEPYTSIDAPYFIFTAAIAALVCVLVSKFAFRHALAWQLSAVALVVVCWVSGAIVAFSMAALVTGVAIGLFRVHSLRVSIALYSAVAIWLMGVLVALHPGIWGGSELGALARSNLGLEMAPLAFATGIQLGAGLHRRMLEAHLRSVRSRAEREISAFIERLWLEPATRTA